jgi:hypothetical protein
VKRFMDGEKEDAGFRVTVGGAKRMKRRLGKWSDEVDSVS